MNRILYYINATLVSLDIPPIIREFSKRSNTTKAHEISESISAETNK